MHETGPRPLGFPITREVVDDRDRRSVMGDLPAPEGSRLVSFESLLKEDMIESMTKNPAIDLIQAEPETFSWRDAEGRRRRYTPAFLVVTVGGAKVYREVRPAALLTRDPEFSGRRARIELECAVRSATFEVWTEREIREDQQGFPLLRVATAAEADLYRGTRSSGTGAAADGRPHDVPGIVRHLAERFGLADMRRIGDAFVARSHVTGILMVVLCGLAHDMETGMLVWKPTPRANHQHDRRYGPATDR